MNSSNSSLPYVPARLNKLAMTPQNYSLLAQPDFLCVIQDVSTKPDSILK